MKKYIMTFGVSLLLLLLEIFFFRNILFNGGLLGDIGDGRLTTLIAEHWWHFFSGKDTFTNMKMMYPAENVVGYTDMLLGFGIIHSIFRFFSFDIFSSYKFSLMLIHFFGTICTYWLCRKKMNVSVVWSLFATVAFSFSNAYSQHSCHTQLYALSILPLLTIFLFDFVEANIKNKQMNFPAFVFLSLFILLMYNSWYVAYFTALFIMVFVIIYAVMLYVGKLSYLPFTNCIRRILPNIAVYALFSGILLIPFLYIYLPVVSSTEGYSYTDAAVYLPRLKDFINVGEDNFLLGNLMKHLTVDTEEQIIGFSVILLGMFLLMLCVSLSENKKILNDTASSSVQKYLSLSIVSVFFSIIVCLLLILKLSDIGTSFWYIIYHIPAGNSIRAIARFAFWLTFPMALITAYTADKFWKPKYKQIISVIVLVAVFVTNIHKNGVYSKWNKDDALNFVSQITPPPADLEAFFVVNNDYGYPHNSCESTDAFLIASVLNIPTINGYSGKYPQNYRLHEKQQYLQAVNNWIKIKHLQNVYAYDVKADEWIPYELYVKNNFKYTPGDVLNFAATDKNQFYVISGFSTYESTHTWTEGNTAELRTQIGATDNDLMLSVEAWPFVTDKITQQTVQVLINGEKVADWEVKNEDVYTAVIPNKLLKSRMINLKLIISNPTSPEEVKISSDKRKLGLAIKNVTISEIKEKTNENF